MKHYAKADGTLQVEETWACPDCGFSFGVDYADDIAGQSDVYSCPVCAETELVGKLREIHLIMSNRLSPSPSVMRVLDLIDRVLVEYPATPDVEAS